MQEVIFETVESNDVVQFDKVRYNSNNHWEILPSDYFDVLENVQTVHWIDAFRSTYDTIEFDSADIFWMKKAAEIGQTTGRFSKCYEDELEDTLKKYESQSRSIFGRKDHEGRPVGYFVRTDTVSLKHGQHGVGPYFSLKAIIESSCSCIHGHRPVDPTTTSLKYYILPWVPINMDMEFRVFVCSGQITCISSQGCYKINKTLSSLSREQRLVTLRKWITLLVSYINRVKSRISLTSYSIDIALVEKGSFNNTRDEPAESSSDGGDGNAQLSFTFSEEELATADTTTDTTTTTAATESSITTSIDSVSVSNDLEAYLIELNPFGKEYAAGSSLFHWLIDEQQMYDLKGERKIYVRYIIS